MAYVQFELDAESVVEAMNEDAVFLLEMLEAIADRVDMGMMRDNAGDLAGQMDPDKATFLANCFASLSEAIKSGFNMSNHEQI